MRILLALFALLSLLVPSMLEAAGDKKGEPAGAKKAKQACKRSEISGLVLEVCVPAENIIGARIICTVTVTNKSKQRIRYDKTGPLREFVIEIKDREGTAAAYTRFGKLVFEGEDISFIRRQLAPGESHTLEYDLTRCFDLSMADGYSLSAVSRYDLVKEMQISVDSVRFSVKERVE
jgi:hypothetical protein